ncbi:BnaC07g31370D [Brassica napus]|uniref:(rape) hypothetical protein n=1 Tax=Brassica napus TaxID=3708 RepID=A0A078G9G3_BRANA|nr:unnamed protein product [Brassica napus]CDY23050.1 BnaC07g31370D [Brassica napus]
MNASTFGARKFFFFIKLLGILKGKSSKDKSLMVHEELPTDP